MGEDPHWKQLVTRLNAVLAKPDGAFDLDELRSGLAGESPEDIALAMEEVKPDQAARTFAALAAPRAAVKRLPLSDLGIGCEFDVIKDEPKNAICVGCAGWAIPKDHSLSFSAEGSHLARYAGVFPAVEINSSFYKPHKPATYRQWAESVLEKFRFAVKVPKEATHVRRLVDTEDVLDRFLAEATALGENLGPLLVQLPPSLGFTAEVAAKFINALRERFDGDVALEPRHASWFEMEADRLLATSRVSRVAADPAVVGQAAEPGGWDGLVYYRLHGSPRVYYSDYPSDYLDALAEKLFAAAARSSAVWCIFDNTAAGAATANALGVFDRVRRDQK